VRVEQWVARVEANDRRIVHMSSGTARNAYAGWSIYCTIASLPKTLTYRLTS